MPFWQPQPRRPRHQGPINSFFLAFKPNPAGQGTKAPSIAFSWRSSLPFASPQTLQMLFWQPQPCRPRHQGPINSFFLAFKRAVCQPSIKPASVVSTEGGVGGTRALAHSITQKMKTVFDCSDQYFYDHIFLKIIDMMITIISINLYATHHSQFA